MPPDGRRSLPEGDLVTPTLRALLRLRLCNQMTPAALELAWHQKRIDMAFLAPGTGLTAIEFKVAAWQRAIDQAFMNRWCSDASWVAVWHHHISARTYAAAVEAGVGLLVVLRTTAYPLVAPAAPPPGASAERLAIGLQKRGTRLRDLLGRLGQESLCTG